MANALRKSIYTSCRNDCSNTHLTPAQKTVAGVWELARVVLFATALFFTASCRQAVSENNAPKTSFEQPELADTETTNPQNLSSKRAGVDNDLQLSEEVVDQNSDDQVDQLQNAIAAEIDRHRTGIKSVGAERVIIGPLFRVQIIEDGDVVSQCADPINCQILSRAEVIDLGLVDHPLRRASRDGAFLAMIGEEDRAALADLGARQLAVLRKKSFGTGMSFPSATLEAFPSLTGDIRDIISYDPRIDDDDGVITISATSRSQDVEDIPIAVTAARPVLLQRLSEPNLSAEDAKIVRSAMTGSQRINTLVGFYNDALPKRKIFYNRPKKLDYNKNTEIVLIIAMADRTGAEAEVAKNLGKTVAKDVSLAEEIFASLTGPKDLVSITPDERQSATLLEGRNRKFVWSVRPITTQSFKLTLALTNVISIENSTRRVELEPYVDEFTVNATWYQRIGIWIGDLNPLVILGTLIAFAFGVWRWFQNTRLRKFRKTTPIFRFPAKAERKRLVD